MDYEKLITDPGFLLVIASQAFAGAFSAVVAIVALKRCRDLHFHVNCRILISTLLVLIFVHSACLTVLQVLQLTRYLLYPDPNKAAIPATVCFGLRFPATVCMTAFAILQVGMIAERAIAVWQRSRYESLGIAVGIIITGLCVIVSALFSMWALMQMNLRTVTVYCSAGTPETSFRVKVLTMTFCGIDGFTLIATGLVFSCNAAAVKRKFFDLQSSYQLKENLEVLRIILPMSTCQAIFHLTFSLSNSILASYESSFLMVTYRTLFAATYIIPYYTMIAPILLMLLLRITFHKRASKLNVLTKPAAKENDMYFTTYSKMWMTTAYNKS
ncbi:unnamed protein product [Cylicocyclus nassatus]|uniref:G protein-coupled receptor n=1 Tax=Cylicocyclus nassatus TaxID=53992 RepID=A0AA36HA72_CYLNA|nr:unnamed protein product [Cylicocyclus nassatus]